MAAVSSSLLLLAFLATAAAAPAAQARLNDALRDQPEGTVVSFQIVPGGTRVVFRGDLSASSESQELYSAPIDGSAPPLLLGTSSLAGLIRAYQVSPDGINVILLNRSPDSSQHLYRLSLNGGAPLLLSAGIDVDATFSLGANNFALDPAGTRVVFRNNDGISLASAPTDASTLPVRLNGSEGSGEIEPDYRISPDGAWVVYRASDPAGLVDLYSAPIDGHAPSRRLNLSRPLGDVLDFQIAFDSLGVVYRADQDTDELFELYAVGIDGNSAPVKRSAAVPTGSVQYFQLAATSDRLVFLVEESAQSELCSVSAIHGGAPLRLASMPTRPPGEFDLALTADGARAVYRALTDGPLGLYGVSTDGSGPAVRLSNAGQSVQEGDDRVRIAEGTGRALYVGTGDAQELFSVALDGSQPPIRLNDAFRQGVKLFLHDVLADGSALYTADPLMLSLFRLYRVPIDGSAPPIALTHPLASGSFVSMLHGEVAGTSAGGHAVYLLQGWVDELFSVPLLGGPSARLAGALPPGQTGGSVDQYFQLSRAGDRAVFLAEETPAYQPDLHSAATDGSGHSIELNPTIGPGPRIQSFALSADGEWTVYRLTNFTNELHASRTKQRGHDVRLDRDPLPPASSAVGDFAITPDSQHVVFAATLGSTSTIEMAPIDGLQAPSTLLTIPNGHGPAIHFVLSPDGAWLFYKTPGTEVLMSLPVDGHQGPAVLDGVSDSVKLTAFTPDSSRVVYLAQRPSIIPMQLCSVLVDGSLPSLTLATTGQGSSFRISPDGARVVFVVLPPVSGSVELRSVPVDGSQAPVVLTSTLANYYRFDDYQIDPTSRRVAYLSLQSSTVDLYSAPIDGSAPAVKLSGELLPGQNVAAFTRDPVRITTSGRVVYAVDDTVGRVSLDCVPLDGSAAPLQLSLDVPEVLELDTHEESALYIAADVLRRVPLDGSAAPELIAPYRVRAFQVAADGEHVIYAADHGNNINELYSAFLARPTRRAGAPTRMVSR